MVVMSIACLAWFAGTVILVVLHLVFPDLEILISFEFYEP